MSLHDPAHPVWSYVDYSLKYIIRPAVLTLLLAFVLWMTAADFDESEGQTIVGFLISAVSAEGLGTLGGKLLSKGN
jgi:hypothetical protein